MCLSQVGQVVEITGAAVVVHDDTGRSQSISLLAYDGPPPAPGSWLLFHSGFALAALDGDDVEGVLASLRTVTGTAPPKEQAP